jgi:hypothetical protein
VVVVGPQVRALLLGSASTVPATLRWTYNDCDDSRYTLTFPNGSITCLPCPTGGNCAAPAEGVVELAGVVARLGFWASNSSGGGVFHECLIPEACLPGVNGSRSMCAEGYSGVLCAVCADGYFEQFGK